MTTLIEKAEIPDWVRMHAEQYLDKCDMRKKHVCLLVHNKKVVCTGYNTRGVLAYACREGYEYSIHAEMHAIHKFKKNHHQLRLCNCVMFVLRFANDGSLASSEPCPLCRKLLMKHGITKCVHS